jgi:hypothetical protein|tara:strand:+ start:19368 stop:19586 length:219 start_codon:yes stop_codon:yes gene_type:complete
MFYYHLDYYRSPLGETMSKIDTDKANKAFELQEKISKLIDKLDDLGFEFMFYNQISSVRRKRNVRRSNKVNT